MNDNAEPDFLEFIRDRANGFLSVTLPLKGSTELCVKVFGMLDKLPVNVRLGGPPCLSFPMAHGSTVVHEIILESLEA